jgi:hypothetical protein
MNRSSALVVGGLLLLSLTPARAGAEVFSYHLDGEVVRILDTTAGGTLQGALTPRGVKKGAAVSIDWTVDSGIGTHTDPNNATRTEVYFGVITSFTIQVGTFTATGGDPNGAVPLNKVQITDHPTSVDLDTMDLFRSGSDTGSILDGNDPNGIQLILHLFDPSGGSSSSEQLGDQTPSLYPARTGTIFGVNGEIDFSRPLSNPPPDTSVKCRAARLTAAGALCKSTFSCLAAHAKAPNRDPGNSKLDTCRGKADAKFLAAWDKAAAAAASKGLTCRSADSGAIAVAHVDAAVDDVVALADTINPPQPALVSAWFVAAGGMCSAAAKAESKNATKPDPAKLAQLRTTARDKLTTAAQKALAKAEKQGVVFDPEPDIAAFVASVDALVDDIVSEVNGP